MTISTTHVTIYSFIPLDLLRNISFSSISFSYISENAVQHKIYIKDRPYQCAICEKNIKTNHSVKAIHCYRDKKSADTIYYMNVFHNSITFITTTYIKYCFIFNHKTNTYSDLHVTILQTHARKSILPLTCTDCDSDININTEVNNCATYLGDDSYKHLLLSCYIMPTCNVNNTIISCKTSEINSVNKQISKEKPFQCAVCDHNNNTVYCVIINRISFSIITILYLCYCTLKCNHNQYKELSKVPHMLGYSINKHNPNQNNIPILFKPLSTTKCDFNYSLQVAHINENENIHVTMIHYKLHATRRG